VVWPQALQRWLVYFGSTTVEGGTRWGRAVRYMLSLPSVGAISDGIAPPQATGPTCEGDGAGTGAWGGAGSLSDRQGRRDGEAQDDQNQDRP
jgi:hypothetical protein